MSITIQDIALCIGCGNCVSTCPCDVFRLENKKTTIAYPEDCQVCSMCTVYCPAQIIVITPEKTTNPMTAYM